ncbi:hypothetical protein A4H97_11240 [Niastella yeongjuensis]|uniref:Fibronectin type-III domain-containing protein n=1 Tax=Niastella yeongjuensis TaxID=354355 RepID=A0A1V9E9D7_9BACT|nr:hypothetical protein [Niastella yeongjuensis]OQP42733.1 hypothetical protein A4H97_11240 [Niastella yeongjuensis]SEO51765.1 TANFOR domain-containing protein [Niastella yeongjuensis]
MLVTLYKKTISRLLIVMACLFLGQLVNAQRYPVQIVPQLLPPYTLNVSDYYNGTNEKLVLLLTNTDLNKPALQVRLRMSIQGQSAKLISRDNVYYPAINLDGGVPARISLQDLAPYFNADNLIFEGITRAQYVQSGKLPEGFYQFCFEAVEVSSGQVVGRSSCAMAWISLSDPPLLNLPRTAESIVYKDPQNIIFQWTPRNYNSPTSAFNTEYEFTLVEIWDNGLAPEAAFGTVQPLYQTTTQATTLLYGPGEPLLLSGHKYAWRVRAQQTDGSKGSDAFRNNGYSEIFWFNCQNNCAAPLNVQHELSNGRATITWTANPNQSSFTVDYREKGQDGATWYNSPTTANRMLLYDLKKDKTYEYRVGGTCDNGITYTYSDIKTLVTPAADSAVNTECGLLEPEANIANRTPIQTLLTGDVISAGDFPVKLLQVSGQGTFTGAGYVTVPFLGQVRVKVQFKGITVNTDKQLIGGVIETTYDPKESQIGNLDKVIEGGGDVGIVVTGVDTADYYIDMVIPDASHIAVELNSKVDSSGNATPAAGATLTVTDSEGKKEQVKVDEVPTTIKDKNGTVYGVDKDGNVSKISSSEVMNMTPAELNSIKTDKAVVKFVPHEHQQYAFDEYQPEYKASVLFREEYEKLNDDYYVSSKAIVEAKADVIKAVVEIKDKSLVLDSIRFVTGKGIRYESTRLADSTSWEIKIVGGPAADAQELYALYPQGGGKYLSLGKLFIAAYEERTFKVVLVPVNEATVNKDQISSQLNKIYNAVGITFQVTEDKPFIDKSWDLNNDGDLAVSGSGWLSMLTNEMKALNNAYSSARTVQQDAIYLFGLKGSDSTSNLLGDMPRGKQFGYLFNDADGKVAAHEIGHGVFRLKHVFDNQYGFEIGGLPSNVMDYPAGDRFAKYQWDQVHDPGMVIGLFEKDADAQLIVSSADALKDLKNAGTNTYTFLSPGGMPVTLPAMATNIVLSETNYFVPKENEAFLHTIPFGTLVSFTLENDGKFEVYTAVGGNSAKKFLQYECSNNDGNSKPYVDNLTAKETSGNVILAWPCFTAPSDATQQLTFNLKAKWFQPGDDVFNSAKSPDYVAGGDFENAEKILEDAANKSNDGKPVYTISKEVSTYSDFTGSKWASNFIGANTRCESMPMQVVMNIANLIKLNEDVYEDFVCKHKNQPETKEEFEGYLAIFQDFLKTGNLKITEIETSSDMQNKLAEMCLERYATLTAAERIKIIEVLTQSGSAITGCSSGHKMECAEWQLINTIKTITDVKQADDVATYLNTNQAALLRLITDVDATEDKLDNHNEMMAALFNMAKLRDTHVEGLTAEDLLGTRLYINGSFDYGAFSMTSTVTQVDFTTGGGSVGFRIEQKLAQVFSPNAGVDIRGKYAINMNPLGNGITWINPPPLDPITVVFGEDYSITGSGVLFKKGDIIRIPALYLWNLFDVDAKQTAALLRANAVKFAVTGALAISAGLAEGPAAVTLATLDFTSSAFSTILSPMLLRQNLSPETREVVEAFDKMGQAYMLFRAGQAAAQITDLLAEYALQYATKVMAARLRAVVSEMPVVKSIEEVVENVEAEVVSSQVKTGGAKTTTDPASGGSSSSTNSPATTTGGQTGIQVRPGTQGPTNTSVQPAVPALGSATVEQAKTDESAAEKAKAAEDEAAKAKAELEQDDALEKSKTDADDAGKLLSEWELLDELLRAKLKSFKIDENALEKMIAQMKNSGEEGLRMGRLIVKGTYEQVQGYLDLIKKIAIDDQSFKAVVQPFNKADELVARGVDKALFRFEHKVDGDLPFDVDLGVRKSVGSSEYSEAYQFKTNTAPITKSSVESGCSQLYNAPADKKILEIRLIEGDEISAIKENESVKRAFTFQIYKKGFKDTNNVIIDEIHLISSNGDKVKVICPNGELQYINL